MSASPSGLDFGKRGRNALRGSIEDDADATGAGVAWELQCDRRPTELHIAPHSGVPRHAIVGRGLNLVTVAAGMRKPKRNCRQHVDALKVALPPLLADRICSGRPISAQVAIGGQSRLVIRRHAACISGPSSVILATSSAADAWRQSGCRGQEPLPASCLQCTLEHCGT